MKRLRIMVLLCLFVMLSSCRNSNPIPRTGQILTQLAESTKLIEETVTSPTLFPTQPLVIIKDGPSILDENYMYEIYGNKSQLLYDSSNVLERGQNMNPLAATVEDEAVLLCDRYFELIADSITQCEAYDLSSLYDLSTKTRTLDWMFNQGYLYFDVLTKAPSIDATYAGSSYYFNWDEWDVEENNGLLVVFTKTEYTHSHGGISSQYGGMDFGSFTNEFALTRIQDELKVIRHRNYDFNYVSMQQRVIDDPHLLDELDSFRAYLDTMVDAPRK